MKIKVNYDLLEKIKESQTGISLKKVNKEVLFYTGLGTMVFAPMYALTVSNPLQETIQYIIRNVVFQFGGFLTIEYLFKKF